MKLHIVTGAVLGCAALLSASAFSQAQSQSQIKTCNMNITFDSVDAAQYWRAVNDGVMGGLSSGGPRFENDHMVFEGVINTNGGGFSSVRANVEPGTLSRASGLSLRVKSDGRAYKVTLRTNAMSRFRPISFQTEIPQTPIGEWAEVKVSFGALRASLFGRPVTDASFDKAEVQEVGIIIADGKDGPFKLDVDWIKDCSN